MDALQLLSCFRHRRQRTQPRRSVTARGHHSEFQRRVIPQIYAPESYEQVKALGYEQIIWTRYRYPGPCSRDPAVARSLRGAVCHHYAALPCQQPPATDRGEEGRPHLCPYDEQSRGAGIICLAVWGNRRLHRFPRTIRLTMKLNFCQSCRILSASWPSVWCRC